MLTADLVSVRRKKGELLLIALDDESRKRAGMLAETYVRLTRERIGGSREEVEEALDVVEVAARDRRVADGLRKLIEDRSDYDVPAGGAPEELRRALFLHAAATRKALAAGAPFPRAAVVAEIASSMSVSPEALERGLYADLRASHTLTSVGIASGGELLDRWESGQSQAVLLRAVRVTVTVECASAAAYRAFFRKLKFLRLLVAIEPKDNGYRLTIEGPYSMFDAVTKYGARMAMLLPTLDECAAWSLVAEVLWGKDRDALIFKQQGGTGREPKESALPDDIAALLEGFRAMKSPWKAKPADSILSLAGAGICVPDLEFTRGREKVFLEVMGYWSREAVWRRVELVEAGVKERILFAVSERLRVSEEVLPPELPSALYVYKGVMSPRVIADRLEVLSARGGKTPKKKKREPRATDSTGKT